MRPIAILALIIAALAVAVGCGDDDSTKARRVKEYDQVQGAEVKVGSTRVAAARAVRRKAEPIVNRAHDRNLPGPKKVKVRCGKPSSVDASGNFQVKCSAVAFTRPTAIADSPGAPFNVNIADEEWIVKFVHGGEVSRVRIGEDGYAISHFLEADDVNNCSGGESLNC